MRHLHFEAVPLLRSLLEGLAGQEMSLVKVACQYQQRSCARRLICQSGQAGLEVSRSGINVLTQVDLTEAGRSIGQKTTWSRNRWWATNSAKSCQRYLSGAHRNDILQFVNRPYLALLQHAWDRRGFDMGLRFCPIPNKFEGAPAD